MAIEISEFLADMKEIRKHIDPEEKIRQWEELKQASQFKTSEKSQSIPKTASAVLIVLSAGPQENK